MSISSVLGTRLSTECPEFRSLPSKSPLWTLEALSSIELALLGRRYAVRPFYGQNMFSSTISLTYYTLILCRSQGTTDFRLDLWLDATVTTNGHLPACKCILLHLYYVRFLLQLLGNGFELAKLPASPCLASSFGLHLIRTYPPFTSFRKPARSCVVSSPATATIC